MSQKLQSNGLLFAAAMWLLSRLLIAVAMLLIAPLLPAPPGGIAPTVGWGVFFAWDSVFYEKIASSGYEYAPERKEYLVAFFPLFPLLIRGVMNLGLPFEVAGTLVNNLAFLGALIVLCGWIEERHGISAARWVTAVLAWCPLSLFGTVIYTEGLYLLFSTAALRAFDRQQYGWVALWGAIATAARPTGIALIPAFVIAAVRERRGAIAYAASLAASGGLLLFSLYCAIRFGEPLLFLYAQQAWRSSLGFDWLGWWKMLMQIVVGTTNWKYGSIKDPWHPLLFAITLSSGYLLWRFRKQVGTVKGSREQGERSRERRSPTRGKVLTFPTIGCYRQRAGHIPVESSNSNSILPAKSSLLRVPSSYGFAFLWLFLWLLAGDPLINVVTIFGGGYLLWHMRAHLSQVTVIYGFCALGLLLASGSTISLSRIAYGIVSLAIALGVLLARHPRWGYTVIVFFAILLTSFSIRFAQEQWVA